MSWRATLRPSRRLALAEHHLQLDKRTQAATLVKYARLPTRNNRRVLVPAPFTPGRR
jgi:hypothetical protein